MPIKLQVRRGTAAQWAQAGVGDVVVLLNGEIGFESDTGNIKIGDGSLVWNNLPYQFPFVKNARGLDTTTLVIDQTTDFIGMGTNSPSNKLHIEGTAPIVRLRDSASPSTTHVLIDADNAEGSLTISADPGAQSTNASKIFLATDGTTRATVDENGRLGIGTQTPSTDLHISTAAPIIRLTDTGAATAYSQISQDNTTGTLTISADEPAQAAGSVITLRTDGANRVIVGSSQVQVLSEINGTGGFTNATISGDALVNGTVAHSKLATSVGFNLFEVRYTSGTNNFAMPTGVYQLEVFVCGGGGGCRAIGNNATENYYGGRPAAHYALYSVTPSTWGTAYTAIVGAGGNVGTGASNGTAGAASSFAGVSCAGGAAGNTGDTVPAQAAVTVSAAPTNWTRLTTAPTTDVYGMCPFGYPIFGYVGNVSGHSAQSPTNWSFTTSPVSLQTQMEAQLPLAPTSTRIALLYARMAGIGAAACSHNLGGANQFCGPAMGGAVIIRYLIKP